MRTGTLLLRGRGVPLHQISRVAEADLRRGRHIGQQGVAHDGPVDVSRGAGGAAGVVAAGIAGLGRVPFAPGADEAGPHVGNDVGIGRQHRPELLQVTLDLRRAGVIAGGAEVVVEPHRGLHAHGAQAGKARVQGAEEGGGQVAGAVAVQLHLGQHQAHAGVVAGLHAAGVKAVDEIVAGPTVEAAVGVGDVGAGGAEAQVDGGGGRSGCGCGCWSRCGCRCRRGCARDVAGLGHALQRVTEEPVAAAAVEGPGNRLVVERVGRPVVQHRRAGEVAGGLARLAGAFHIPCRQGLGLADRGVLHRECRAHLVGLLCHCGGFLHRTSSTGGHQRRGGHQFGQYGHARKAYIVHHH